MRLTIIFLIVIIGCQPKPRQEIEVKWFDLPNLIDELVLNMNTKNHRSSKSFSLNNQSETKEYEKSDTSFWQQELAKLREIDLKSPQIRDVIIINSRNKDNKSNENNPKCM